MFLAAAAFATFGVVIYAVFFDAEIINEDARIGFIGAIIGTVTSNLDRILAFCFPTND